ncbi:exosortase/archaeosortase family protein [Pedococcus dokdonensis]|uniref:Exosortase/archaeosortase family protein n=1 Tax=Pedococcus dokdonensis TaxID=443156 RepID=A0A1H0TZV9_9MICO|nr:archaeosortase/exosortase family protein [Pedococcus dokdonensis]SDP59305.1 exosortase/archaeosortase family protein [Pedococcus dokdonensis]
MTPDVSVDLAPPRQKPNQLASRAMAVALLLVGAALMVENAVVRGYEAGLLTLVLKALGQPAVRAGSTVFFSDTSGAVGLQLTFGCSVGPLIALFALCAAVICWYRAAPVVTAVLAILALSAAFVVCNQIRLLAIIFAIKRWGIDPGYEVSHVFVGSLITTVGFVTGVYVFARILSRARAQAPA